VDIVVFGDATPPAGMVALRAALGRSFAPLRPEEPGFRLLPPRPLKDLRRPREKNVLVLGRTEDPGIWEAALQPWLSPAARQRLSRRGAGWFVFRDVWARGQEVVLLVAPETAGLDSLLRAAAAPLRRSLQRSVVERCLHSTWPDTATAMARELRRRHGFVVAVPGAYSVVPPRSGWPDAVEMVRGSPSRTISVFWIDGVEPQSMRRDAFLLGLQHDAMWRLHEDEVVEDTYTFSTPFGAPERRELRGSWQNRRDIAGGPFITHFLYDASRRRLYAVQALLFAPGQRKAGHLVELEALLRTFQVGSPS
jgi:hypothetical protein